MREALDKAIQELRDERDNIERAIAQLERVRDGGPKTAIAKRTKAKAPRRGRKPGPKPKSEDAPKRKFRKTCAEHGAYVASSPRGACPACHPRNVTAKEAFSKA